MPGAGAAARRRWRHEHAAADNGSEGAAEQHEHGSAYRLAGVDYTTLDAGKRLALSRALATSSFIGARGGTAVDASRGEPAFVFELDGRHFAFVVEGLGTKSIVARQVAETLGVNRFADVAYDTVAAIVNDLCCVGALPLVVNAYFATGSADWYRRAGLAGRTARGLVPRVRRRRRDLGRGRVAVAPRARRRGRHRARRERDRRAARGRRADPRRRARAGR